MLANLDSEIVVVRLLDLQQQGAEVFVSLYYFVKCLPDLLNFMLIISNRLLYLLQLVLKEDSV